ncbi:MAG: hypothetical protein Q9184_006612 [Pyrenodesmia sp. 2 TL-2023]
MADLKKATDTTFTDLGVDSQMSIQIIADFQRLTAVELPAAFFTNFPTPAAVEKELGMPQHPEAFGDLEHKTKGPERPSKQLFGIIAEALGLNDTAFTPSNTFESLGMDSMLPINTLSTFQDETLIELPAAFFAEHATVAAAQKELDTPFEALTQSLLPVKKSQAAVIPAKKTTIFTPRLQKVETAVSRSVLIQGQARSRAAPLFMTTDGDPDTFDVSIEEMASIFVRNIRGIQPEGPYLIGGWSAGAIYAYEVAHRLAREGETILSLSIIDMRAPSLIPTAIVAPEFVDKLGTFEGINRARDLPEDLSVHKKAHQMGTCRALSRYDAPAFPPDNRPHHSTIIWARSGLDQRENADVAAMLRPGLDIGKPLDEMDLPDFTCYFNSWFYGRREQFGTNGCETLLGDKISVYDVDGGELIP